MKQVKLFSILSITAGLLTMSSCKKGYLDVNTDPSNPTVNSVEIALPTAEGFVAYDMGSPLQIIGSFWGQYWTQGPTGSQYVGYDQYLITSANFDRQWRDLYSGSLNDFRYIVEEGQRVGKKNYAAIAKFMQAHVFQILTDLHGDIPFSDALKGTTGNIAPKFDSQQDVYDGLIKLVDEGIALIDDNTEHPRPGADDFIYGGDMTQWRRFANTLKLKIYLRQAYVRPAVAQAGIAAMYTAHAEFIDQGDEASVPFFNVTFNTNPLYTTIKSLGDQNILASLTSLNYLQTLNDPRVDKFYKRATAAPNAGNHAGILQGNGKNLTGTLSQDQFSKPGDAVAGATAPVIFISEAESYFLQAEAVVRGWGTGNAQQLYNNGITLSFLRWGFSAAQATTYTAQAGVVYPAAGTAEQKIKAIITQKWVSMNGTEGVEGWTEWRRTGYPDFFTISASTNIGPKFPTRLLYPDSEKDSNPNTPASKTVTDKMWWDVNTTGQN